jgi:protein TonB
MPAMIRPALLPLAAAVALFAAPAGASADLQVYFQSTLASASYQQAVFGKLARAWKQPARKKLPAPGKKAVVQAVIGRDGKLISSTLSMASGAKAWDAAALAAVRRAAPFPPLPAAHPGPSVEVHFHFAWKQ